MLCVVLMTLGITAVFFQTPTAQVTNSALIQIVQQLANQTQALEHRLNQEVQTQLALLQEVQSKNDQTQFLQGDIDMLNQTLQRETEEKIRMEKRILDLESKVTSLEATVAESKGCCTKLEARIITVENKVPPLAADIKQLNQTINSLLVTTAILTDLNITVIQTDHSKINTLDNELMALNAKIVTDNASFSNEIKLMNATLRNTADNVADLRKQIETANTTLLSSVAAVEANVKAINAQVNKTLDEEVSKLKREIQSLNTTMSKQLGVELSSIAANKGTVQSLSSGIQQLQSQVIATNTKLQNLNLNISDLRAANVRAPAILFSVSRPEETIVQQPHFTKVIYNIGGAFDTTTSEFVAPLSGQYLFTATIHKSTEGNGISCWIRLNGRLLVSINAHAAFPGTDASGSNTVTVIMVKGDRLELSECQGNSKFSQDGSTFSGVLLSAS